MKVGLKLAAIAGMFGLVLVLPLSSPARAQEDCSASDAEGDPDCEGFWENKYSDYDDSGESSRPERAFGALAYSEAGGGWSAVWNYPSAAKAKDGALGDCRKHSAGGCKVMLSYANQCAAVARALDNGKPVPGNDSVNTGGSKAKAEANAIKSCRADWGGSACQIVISNCSQN